MFRNKDRTAEATGTASPAGLAPIGGMTRVVMALCVIAATLVSCATGPHTFTADPLGLLGEDAAWYAVVPVAENRPILEAVSRHLQDGDEFMKNLDRASMLYLAGTAQQSAGEGGSFPFRLVAAGSFPPKMASVAFPARKGWEKVSAPDGVWYRNGSMAASIPRPGLLFLGSPEDLPEMLRSVRTPVEVPVVDEFRTLVPRSGTGDGTLAVYVRDGNLVRDRLLGDSPFSLPVTGLLVTIGTAIKNVETPYLAKIRVYLPDERTTRAMTPIMRLLFSSTVRAEGSSLILELPSDAEDIAEFLDFLYF